MEYDRSLEADMNDASMEELEAASSLLDSLLALTDRDLELINEQCVLQNAITPGEISRFTTAYISAKRIRPDDLASPEEWLTEIRLWGEIIDSRNFKGYRTVPVIFADTSQGLEPSLIRRAMFNWADAWIRGVFSPEEAYTEFEKIHPFIDGNGRLGHLIWAVSLVRIGQPWPVTLPPDVFGGAK